MEEDVDGPLHAGIATAWVHDIGDVFVASIRHHGHFWRIAPAVRASLRWLEPQRTRRGAAPWDPILLQGLALLDLIEWKSPIIRLSPRDVARGVFLCA